MSIRGIDAQIMISRLTDSVRETSVMHKRLEVAQDALAAKEKINDAEARSKVARTSGSDMEKIRSDVYEGGGGNGGGGSEGSGNRGEDSHDDKSGLDMTVPTDNHMIDIMV
jgi:hypothetical protein